MTTTHDKADLKCKECGSPAYVKDGKIVRSCNHTGTVISSMVAKVKGIGRM